MGVAGRLSGTVSPFRAEQGTSLAPARSWTRVAEDSRQEKLECLLSGCQPREPSGGGGLCPGWAPVLRASGLPYSGLLSSCLGWGVGGRSPLPPMGSARKGFPAQGQAAPATGALGHSRSPLLAPLHKPLRSTRVEAHDGSWVKAWFPGCWGFCWPTRGSLYSESGT